MLTVYGDSLSGNCYKVKLLLELLHRPHEWVHIDVVKGESRTPAFLAKNPNGRIPLLEYEPGATLPKSNAILHYLAEGRLPTQRPARPRPRPGVDVLRAVQSRALHRDLAILDQVPRPRGGSPRRVGQAPRTGIRRAWRHGAAPRARLPYFVGERCTIADIALYAYTHVAHEGGFSLAGFPAVRAWIARVEDEPGYAPMT